MLCQKCNVTYAAGASNCAQCGSALVSAAPPPQYGPPPAYGHYPPPPNPLFNASAKLTKAKVNTFYMLGTLLTLLVVVLDTVRHILNMVGFNPYVGELRSLIESDMRGVRYATRPIPLTNSILGIFITLAIGALVLLALRVAANYLSSTCKE